MRARCGEKAGQRQHPQEAPKPLENCIPQGVSHDQRSRDHNARKRSCVVTPAAMLSLIHACFFQVLADILRLYAEERSALAAALIDSVETSEEGAVVEAWLTELLRRRQELRAGVLQPAPWSEVRARMSAM